MMFSAPAYADDEPKKVQMDVVPDDMIVLTDGEAHFVAVVPWDRHKPRRFFYGDGKKMYRLNVKGASANRQKKTFTWTFWEPRWSPKRQTHGVHSNLEFEDNTYSIKCAERRTELKEVPADKRRVLLATATYYEPLWRRTAYALARDDRGTYYYVDRRTDMPDSRAFRVWRGPRGNMKALKMKNVVYDSAGAIFSTDKGELRLVLNTEKPAYWVQGEKQTGLISLPLWPNRYLIYAELGVYLGTRLGTPCDDM